MDRKVTNLPLVSWKEIPSWLLVCLLATELSVTVTLHVDRRLKLLQITPRNGFSFTDIFGLLLAKHTAIQRFFLNNLYFLVLLTQLYFLVIPCL